MVGFPSVLHFEFAQTHATAIASVSLSKHTNSGNCNRERFRFRQSIASRSNATISNC